MERILLIGGDGLIGTAFNNHLTAHKFDFYKTTRREKNSGNQLFFDLNDKISKFRFPENIKKAYILVGMNGIANCEEKPELAKHLNVDQTINLIRHLNENQIHAVFFSSSEVFNGEKKNVLPEEAKNPRSHYGLCKALVVDFIIENSSNAPIVRCGKVFQELPILKKWRSEISNGVSPSILRNKFISPITPNELVNQLLNNEKRKHSLVNQISGAEDLSYIQIFKHYFNGHEKIFRSDLIQPTANLKYESLSYSGMFEDVSPISSWKSIQS